MLKSVGMKVSDLPGLQPCQLPPRQKGQGANQAIAAIEAAMKQFPAKPKLLFVILSNSDKSIYNGIKYLCDVKHDIHCVCVQAAKIRKEKGQVRHVFLRK
jgi:eukaryotic translation initiation factor 2C